MTLGNTVVPRQTLDLYAKREIDVNGNTFEKGDTQKVNIKSYGGATCNVTFKHVGDAGDVSSVRYVEPSGWYKQSFLSEKSFDKRGTYKITMSVPKVN